MLTIWCGIFRDMRWTDERTGGSSRRYPGQTRVNHTKYIADHTALIRTLQAVFDRDWASSYAWRLT
jgi:hypothetical protein